MATPLGRPVEPEVYIMYAREEGRGVCIGGVSGETGGVRVGEGGIEGMRTFASMKIGVGPPSQVTVSVLSRVVIMMLAATSPTINLTRSAGASRLMGQNAAPVCREASWAMYSAGD